MNVVAVLLSPVVIQLRAPAVVAPVGRARAVIHVSKLIPVDTAIVINVRLRIFFSEQKLAEYDTQACKIMPRLSALPFFPVKNGVCVCFMSRNMLFVSCNLKIHQYASGGRRWGAHTALPDPHT